MKKIFSYISVAALLVAGLTSCETYKVTYPGGTAVSNMDGTYLCFAYDKSDLSTPVIFYELEVTNTESDASDAMWFNMIDYRSANALGCYPEAVRFKVSCDVKDQTFNCSLAETFPVGYIMNKVQYNYYGYGMEYANHSKTKYSYSNTTPDYTVNITDGSIVTDGVDTETGYKTDGISFNYVKKHADGTIEEYIVIGMKNTGWIEDVAVYDEWINDDWGF